MAYFDRPMPIPPAKPLLNGALTESTGSAAYWGRFAEM
jgi:hypothetical protein